MSDKQLLTNSAAKTFRECKRKYQFRYEQGYVRIVESPAMFFGSLIHKAIEIWSLNKRSIEPAIEFLQNAVIVDEYERSKAVALMDGYHNKYKDEAYEILAVEPEFTAPLINPETMQESRLFMLGGKMDAVYKNGRIMVKEIKTTSDDIAPDSNYWDKLTLDSQVSQYYLGAQALGYNAESCLYDVIKKPTIRPKQVGKEVCADDPKRLETPQEYYERLAADINERPEFYFARREVPRLQADLEEFLFDAWNEAQSLRAAQLSGKWSRNPDACVTILGTCEFFAVCTKRVSITDETQYKVEKKHRELGRVA